MRLRRRVRLRHHLRVLSAPTVLAALALDARAATEQYLASVPQQPDGFAEAALELAEYRTLDPSPWEERIFYDHPSGRTRIYTAMVWKQELASARSPGSVPTTAPPPPR